MSSSAELPLNFSTRGREIVQQHEERWTREARFRLTLERVVRDWITFSERVERGYTGYFEEYLDDLTTRDLLDEVIRALPRGDASLVEARISGADQTYRQATRPDEGGELAKMFRIEPDDGWWWRRFPRQPLTDPE